MLMNQIIVNLYFFTDALKEKLRLNLFLLQTLYFHYGMGNLEPKKYSVEALHNIRGGILPCIIK